MEFSAAYCLVKIKYLLEKLLQSKCQINIDSYINNLLVNLSPQEKTETESVLIKLPLFTEWMTRAVATWSSNRTTPATDIATFTLNLASWLAKNEDTFSSLNNNNFFIKLVNVMKARQPEVAPSVKLAYIQLLSSFLEHKSGLEWMVTCNFWEDVLRLSLAAETTDVTKASHNFMSKILENTIDFDENFCNNVVQRIMLLLSESICRFNKPFPESTDGIVSQNLTRALQLIGNILEYFLEGILFDQKDFRVVLIFWKNFHLEERISNFMPVAQNEGFVFDFKRVMFIMQFLELHVSVASNNYNEASAKCSVQKLMNVFVSNISKGHFEDFLKFCNFGQLYWSLMGSKIPCCKEDKNNEAIAFANELMLLKLLPNFYFILKYCRIAIPDLEVLLIDELRDDFIQKILKTGYERTCRICYVWRDYLTMQVDLFDISLKSLLYTIHSRKYFSKERAVLAFQALIYTLKDFTFIIKEDPAKIEIFINQVSYFSSLFDVLAILIEEFSITWKDSFEAIDVIAVSFDFLSLPNWPAQVVVKTLKLINIAIAKYMSPNLALLVDSATDSTVALLGPLLYLKLRDDEPKVKETALDVVCTISRMSNIKFPSLQKVLMDSELPTLVVKMSTCDGESFVRATAIKCLQEMIQVEEIWNNALKTENLPEKMREILLNETEGIVRVEAATFMCTAYEQQQFPKDTLDRVYETMIHSSTTDLHWEVKVRALGFWDKVIKNHLQNQGMIDGSFPNVTFSKEHRKIVTLTDSEIRKRLQKVLSQLSSIGCLGVLVSAIKDDCDMEVSKTAVKITQRLVELFKKYKIYGDYSAPTSPSPTENGVSSSVSVSSGISVDEAMDSPTLYHSDFNDEIIDQIVNSKDVSLLKNVYSPSDYGSVCNYDIQVRKIVTPAEFVQYTQQDLNNIITEKKNWLNGIEDLGSLLDDMLKTYDDDVNNMDCY